MDELKALGLKQAPVHVLGTLHQAARPGEGDRMVSKAEKGQAEPEGAAALPAENGSVRQGNLSAAAGDPEHAGSFLPDLGPHGGNAADGSLDILAVLQVFDD